MCFISFILPCGHSFSKKFNLAVEANVIPAVPTWTPPALTKISLMLDPNMGTWPPVVETEEEEEEDGEGSRQAFIRRPKQLAAMLGRDLMTDSTTCTAVTLHSIPISLLLLLLLLLP